MGLMVQYGGLQGQHPFASQEDRACQQQHETQRIERQAAMEERNLREAKNGLRARSSKASMLHGHDMMSLHVALRICMECVCQQSSCATFAI
jgi:hypothetical protein